MWKPSLSGLKNHQPLRKLPWILKILFTSGDHGLAVDQKFIISPIQKRRSRGAENRSPRFQHLLINSETDACRVDGFARIFNSEMTGLSFRIMGVNYSSFRLRSLQFPNQRA